MPAARRAGAVRQAIIDRHMQLESAARIRLRAIAPGPANR
jgi:hypothetical protein